MGKLQKPPEKVRESAVNTEYLTVWEGSVRSGKTITSLFAWIKYILESEETAFLMSGFTSGTVFSNCIDAEYGLCDILGVNVDDIARVDSKGRKYLNIDGNRIYYTGADSVASYKRIRGMTLGGWYADEINLHHRAFVEEALRRTIASTDRRHMWTLNPDIPTHWLYKEYLDRYAEDQLPGYKYYHFTLDDNPALTEERKKELAQQYRGVFYDRYILGRRVRAEGICYPSFSRDSNVIDKLPEGVKIMYAHIGADIGGNKSATVYVLTGFYTLHNRLNAVVLDVMYDNTSKQTEQILSNYKRFLDKSVSAYNVTDVYIDSAEQLIKGSMERYAIANVHNSIKKTVTERIRGIDLLFSRGQVLVMSRCVPAIEAIESAIWNDKSVKEERLDDGTTDVDTLDAMEYSLEPCLVDMIETGGSQT